jgi:hypothetical protein
MHEVHRGRRLLPCAQRQHEETSTGVGRQRIKRKLLATGDRVRWRVGVLVGCGRACVSRPGHPVAWRPRAVEQLSRHDKVRSGRRTHATTREDHQSGAGDPAQGMRLMWKVLLAQRPTRGHDGRLAGAGTDCGDGAEPIWRTSQDDSFRAARAPQLWPCQLPNDPGPLHETPSMELSCPRTAIIGAEIAGMDARHTSPTTACRQRLQHHASELPKALRQRQ